MENKELDRLVIERVLKLPYQESEFGFWVVLNDGEDAVLFRPSSNIQDAWIVLDRFCEEHNWRVVIEHNQNFTDLIFKNQMGVYTSNYSIAENPMLAICSAVLETEDVEV